MDTTDLQRFSANWAMECFDNEHVRDPVQRNHRFLEEALELVQALDCPRDAAHRLVDYVYDRKAGEPSQEVGGVMMTLAVLCNVHGLDIEDAWRTELRRVNQPETIKKIRAKQAAKDDALSPLPGVSP